MTTMPQAMPRAMLGALRQASRKHSLTHAARNAWCNASSYARTYERTYLRTLFKTLVETSRNVSRAKCATIHPCPGAQTPLRTRLTDRHRPCRQAVDELAALVTAERDRQRDEDGITRYLREQLAAEQNRAHKTRAILDHIAGQAADGLATADVTECLWDVVKDLAGPAGLEHRLRGDTGSVVLHIDLADGLDGPTPNPLTSPNPSGPPVTQDPPWIDCGTPTCTSCWLQRHDGHDVGMRHEDGALHSATCHDCGARHSPYLSNPQAPTNPSADHHG